MGKSDSQLGQFDVTARLFQRISNLPLNQQFITFEELIKEDVATHLFQIVIDLSEDQKIELLEQLDEMPFEEIPLKTLNLDENSTMRKYSRKACSIQAACAVNNYSFKCQIVDINTYGLLLKTDEAFPIGEKIQIAFALPNAASTLKLSGEVAWSSLEGIGVKFRVLPVPQKRMIQEFVSGQVINKKQ